MRIANHFFGFLLAALFAFTGCAELGHSDSAWPFGSFGADVTGQIISHDSQYNVIEISRNRGERFTFVYDRDTRFSYRGSSSGNPPAPGDEVAVTLRNQRDAQGRPYASVVTVRQTSNVGGGGSVGGQVIGEIISHDSQYNVIEMSRDRGGRFIFVYDRDTRFLYRGSSYGNPPAAGDDIAVTLRNQRDAQGRPYASVVTVRQTARNR